MKKSPPILHAVPRFAFLLLLVASLGVLIGCTNEGTPTAPRLSPAEPAPLEFVEPPDPGSLAEVVGHMILPEGLPGKMPVPSHFEAVVVSFNWVQLSWHIPAVGFTAMISCDGEPLCCVDARTGSYLDRTARAAGPHVYSICFGKCNSVGEMVSSGVTLHTSTLKEPGDAPEAEE